jgi:hypothetical protein
MLLSKFITLLFVTASLQAATVFSVTIDTSSLPAATPGYLDFLFNGGGTPFDPATAAIGGFSTNGTLNAASVSRTNSTGTLPGAVSLSNSNAEYLEGIAFGATIGFNLQFTGPAITSPSGTGSGSTFTLSLLNSTQDGAYLTSNVNDGFLLEFNIDTHGNITPVTYTTATGAPSVVSIAAASTVPEPANCFLAVLGLLGIAKSKKRCFSPKRV